MEKFQILFSRESLNNISNHLNLNYCSNLSKKDYFYSNQTSEKIISIDCIDFLYNSKYCINYLKRIF